jgi:hypothetical protein
VVYTLRRRCRGGHRCGQIDGNAAEENSPGQELPKTGCFVEEKKRQKPCPYRLAENGYRN